MLGVGVTSGAPRGAGVSGLPGSPGGGGAEFLLTGRRSLAPDLASRLGRD